jgi:AraC-like DNA-binding protein
VQTKILHHPDLTTAEICVAVVLASHVNDRTQACFPKIETIAREANLSDRKVRQALKRLSELGLVAKLSRAVGRLRNRNAYQLVGLGSKPASGSIIPASDSGVKPARDAGSNKKNTDKEENTDEREQANAVSGTGATVLPAVDDQCLILAREWQRLCSEPWTLANACLRVNEAVRRVGFKSVRKASECLRAERQMLPRLNILDALDGLALEPIVDDRAAKIPAMYDPNSPLAWQEVCEKIAQWEVPGCRNPRMWLSQLEVTIKENTFQLVGKNRCAHDMTRNHLLTVIRPLLAQRGFGVDIV